MLRWPTAQAADLRAATATALGGNTMPCKRERENTQGKKRKKKTVVEVILLCNVYKYCFCVRYVSVQFSQLGVK